MNYPPRTAALDAVVPRVVTSVHVGLLAFLVLALLREPLDLEWNLAVALAVTNYRYRRAG
jgi:hypothetical protein